ncbi:transcriptional regulator [Streptomyces sp. NPDC005574]|uniref:MmyB family transcriptional regulator n=1 Tax=Streptomyces sp. NPDC005574 TaxID=3156891 RepID=UPI0033BF5962
MEQGRARGVSEEVLLGVAQALQLDETELNHLFGLAHALGSGTRRRSSAGAIPTVRPSLQVLLETITGGAAIMMSEHGDVLGANAIGRALYADMFAVPGPLNMPKFIFLDPAARALHPDWEEVADTVIALLRAAAGRNPFARSLTDVVGELCTRSDYFRTGWAKQNVHPLTTGHKRFRHRHVGDLSLDYEYLNIADGQGIVILTYFAKEGTPAHDGLQLLAAAAQLTQR